MAEGSFGAHYDTLPDVMSRVGEISKARSRDFGEASPVEGPRAAGPAGTIEHAGGSAKPEFGAMSRLGI